MVTYVQAANANLRLQLQMQPSVVVFGQNVDAGSRLAGLAASFSTLDGVKVINSTNSENTLVGSGFGLMLREQPSLLLLKQADFLLLGIDQLVNTWNALRHSRSYVPFVIGVIVVDSGWEGPQSGFNNTSGIASLAGMPWYTPTGSRELELACAGAFGGGPQILAFSQRLFRDDVIADESDAEAPHSNCVSYRFNVDGPPRRKVLIFSLNFSLPQCLHLARTLRDASDTEVTVLSMFKGPVNTDAGLDDLTQGADEILIVSDEKNAGFGPATQLALELQSKRGGDSSGISICGRSDMPSWSVPASDVFDIRIDPSTA